MIQNIKAHTAPTTTVAKQVKTTKSAETEKTNDFLLSGLTMRASSDCAL